MYLLWSRNVSQQGCFGRIQSHLRQMQESLYKALICQLLVHKETIKGLLVANEGSLPTENNANKSHHRCDARRQLQRTRVLNACCSVRAVFEIYSVVMQPSEHAVVTALYSSCAPTSPTRQFTVAAYQPDPTVYACIFCLLRNYD